MNPNVEEKTGARQNDIGKKEGVEGGSQGRGNVQILLPFKTTLTVLDAMAMKAANIPLCPGVHGVLVHAHIKTPLLTVMKVLFVVNSVKLYLTAFNF